MIETKYPLEIEMSLLQMAVELTPKIDTARVGTSDDVVQRQLTIFDQVHKHLHEKLVSIKPHG